MQKVIPALADHQFLCRFAAMQSSAESGNRYSGHSSSLTLKRVGSFKIYAALAVDIGNAELAEFFLYLHVISDKSVIIITYLSHNV